MIVKQIATVLNTVSSEILGVAALSKEDLSNIVEVGDTFANKAGLDNYVKKLNDVIGRMVFVDRVYAGQSIGILRDSWEYGSILEKVWCDLPDAEENESWELTSGASYDPNIFQAPAVGVKCYNQRVTYQVHMSFTEKQIKSSFNSAAQMNSFISMIYDSINNTMVVKNQALELRALNNMIGETFYNLDSSGTYTGKTGVRAVNLLYEYNTLFTDNTETATSCLTSPEFLRFAAKRMMDYKDRMKVMSTLFNIGGKARFTPDDRLHVVLLSEFANSANAYLTADTFHDEMVSLPEHVNVPYFQGSGTDYAFTSTGKVYIKTASGHDVTATGVIGCMFDSYCCAVTCEDPRTTTQYNPAAEFWNEWHKWDAGILNDTNENFVVFYVAAA